ncbi:hypothetical protein MANES_08G032350v8 [Manihot esculenta]|uniref:Uncharacterized protein n=1 Tax=Manihot esculenta TaxID=3983 RepID=A0ACB7H9I9_MANES|nr:hypothetical protein MANES_08G032350v8 [Manihot esculenta]
MKYSLSLSLLFPWILHSSLSNDKCIKAKREVIIQSSIVGIYKQLSDPRFPLLSCKNNRPISLITRVKGMDENPEKIKLRGRNRQ